MTPVRAGPGSDGCGRPGSGARARACARGRRRSSTRSAAARCWPTSSTPGTTPGLARRHGRGRRTGGRLLAGHRGDPRGRRRPRPPRAAGRAARNRRRRARRARRAAGRRRRDPRPVRRRAAASIAEQLVAVVEQRRLDDAAIALASVFAADPAELGRVVRSEFGSVERIVEARDATPDELETNEVNAGVYAFDAAWLRRRIGALDALGLERRAVPHGPDPARPRGRPDRERRRVRRRRHRSTASTTAASSPRPSGRCASGSTRRHMRAGRHDARPVDGLSRLRRQDRLGRHRSSRASSCAAPPRSGRGSTIGPDTTIDRLDHRRRLPRRRAASSRARRSRTA